MPQLKRLARDRRGSALIMFTLMLPFVIIPLVGLAIDGAMLFLVKAKLVASVDGGAIAAARSLNVGIDFAAQKATAEKTADQFVQANFPDGYLKASNLTIAHDVKEDNSLTYRRRTVEITATVDVPLTFMQIAGFGSTTVAAKGMAARRDVRLVLVLDKSGSMSTPMEDMKSAARDFVSRFSEGRDQLGLVAYGTSGFVAYPPWGEGSGPNNTFKTTTPSIDTLISGMTTVTNVSRTNMAEGLWLAYQELKNTPLPGALNLIVLFTDGMPNGFTADFNRDDGTSVIKSSSGCTYKKTLVASRIMRGVPIIGAWSPGVAGNGIYAPWVKTTNSSVEYWLGPADDVILPEPPAKGCSYKTNAKNLQNDVDTLPVQDIYGNRTDGTGYLYSRMYQLYPRSYTGKVNDTIQVAMASWNAADSAAQRIRSDPSGLDPIIYTIGLEGNNGPDPALMRRIANVADTTLNPGYDSSKPAGKYFPASDANRIQAAFNMVASEILRIVM